MTVNAGIEGSDYQKAKDLIAQELKNIQNGDFSNDEIDLALLIRYPFFHDIKFLLKYPKKKLLLPAKKYT